MLTTLASLLIPGLVVIIVVFLSHRLGFFASRDVGGRYWFLGGGSLLFLAAVWQAVKAQPGFPDWFVASAYPIIGLVQLFLAGAGVLAAVVGLALLADHWQTIREDLDTRQSKLSILENLQHDARQPYHLLELLNISLREILIHFPMAAGAVFLVNRTRRQFVLTSSSGLAKDEIAHLEYYPLERNAVSHAVELGDPMLLSRFDFYDRAGKTVTSRFHSCLILPLVTGMERIGGLILFSEESKFFDRNDIRCLMPVSQWLAEVIKSARLGRELSQARAAGERLTREQVEFITRVAGATRGMATGDPVTAFCRSLVGAIASESAHLCGMRRGELVIFGGSRPLFELSENYRAALADALSRARPLIINQESGNGDDRHSIVLSTLVYPLPSSGVQEALLLVREDQPFVVSDDDLKQLDALAGLASQALDVDSHHRLDLSRRKGLEAIIGLLKADEAGDPTEGLASLLERLLDALPPGTRALSFTVERGTLRPVRAVGFPVKPDLADIEILSSEGGLGRATTEMSESFLVGRVRVQQDLESYREPNRHALARLFAEGSAPGFVAYCPISKGSRATGAIMIAVPSAEESQRVEWERLITLACGLYSLRLTMRELTAARASAVSPQPSSHAGEQAVNELNNHLSAVVGTAQLAAREPGLSPELKGRLDQIVSSAERAAGLVRAGTTLAAVGGDGQPELVGEGLSEVVGAVLTGSRVSGDVYMAGQRAREIRRQLEQVGAPAFGSHAARELFQAVLDRFSSQAEEDDVITVATYATGDYIYLDISRHHRSFPPVDRVAGFGRYMSADLAMESRPSDVFLRHLTGVESYYAYDRESPVPAYLSFKFPVRKEGGPVSADRRGRSLRVLVIDDQAVILDLLSAMGQSLGYEVRTAANGEEGLRIFRREEFDLVLTDLALPGLSGLEIARQIRALRPQIPVILVTGWASHIDQADLQSAGIMEVLYKPFRIEQLTEAVHRALPAPRH